MLALEDLDTDSLEGAPLEDSDLVEAIETGRRLEDSSGFGIAMPDGIHEEEVLDWLYRDLHRGEMAQAVLAEAAMRRVAEFNSRFEHRLTEGYQMLAHVPVEVFNYWTAREGINFWVGSEAKKNLDFLAHRAGGGLGNPGFLVKSRNDRTTVVVDQKLPACSGQERVDHGQSAPGVRNASGASPRRRKGRWAP